MKLVGYVVNRYLEMTVFVRSGSRTFPRKFRVKTDQGSAYTCTARYIKISEITIVELGNRYRQEGRVTEIRGILTSPYEGSASGSVGGFAGWVQVDCFEFGCAFSVSWQTEPVVAVNL